MNNLKKVLIGIGLAAVAVLLLLLILGINIEGTVLVWVIGFLAIAYVVVWIVYMVGKTRGKGSREWESHDPVVDNAEDMP